MATRVTALILTLGFSLSVRAEEVPQYEWKKITMTAEFAPRDGAGAISYNGKMWMVAGNNMEPDVWKLQRKSE